MKHLKVGTLILLLSFLGCHQAKKKSSVKTTNDSLSKDTLVLQNNKPESIGNKSDSTNDKEDIQLLVRKVLLWAESGKAPDLTPEITNSTDSICIGFDNEKVKSNLKILKSTEYFSIEFIENYYHIIQTLEKDMKDEKLAPFSTKELPPFNFANDVDLWCDCQDVSYDTPNAYGLVEVHIINMNKEQGELYWSWGGLKPDNDPSWKEFKYNFRVKKEDNKWKISYLEGFNFEQSVKHI